MYDAATVEPSQPPQLAAILLHGLATSGHDCVPFVEHMQIPPSCPVRFVFPHAPFRSVPGHSAQIRAWYDMYGPTYGQGLEDESGIKMAAEHVKGLIEQQIAAGMRYDQIVVGGISQGGAVGLYTALRYHAPLAGVVAMSTFLPLKHRLQNERNEANFNTPIFLTHGHLDTVIPITAALELRWFLTGLGYTVDWYDYQIDHWITPQEIKDLGSFLAGRCQVAIDRR